MTKASGTHPRTGERRRRATGRPTRCSVVEIPRQELHGKQSADPSVSIFREIHTSLEGLAISAKAGIDIIEGRVKRRTCL